MQVFWTEDAITDLEQIRSWLESIEGSKPKTVMGKIQAGAEKLARLGDIGRPSKVGDTREISITAAPYVLVYRCKGDQIEIIAVFHTAQDR